VGGAVCRDSALAGDRVTDDQLASEIERTQLAASRSRRGYVGVHVTRVRRASGARVSCYQVRYSGVVPVFPAEPVSRDINGIG
jgi:hypothetical protein